MISQKDNQNNKVKESYFNTSLTFLKEEKAQKITGVTLTLLALSFFGFFAISPTFSTIAKLVNEIKENEFVSKSLEEKITNLYKLRTQYGNIQNDLPIIDDILPKKANIPTLVAQIQSIARDSNIKINNFQNFEVELIKNQMEKKDYYTFNFSLTGEGSYASINEFISNLISMQRIVVIDTLTIEKSQSLDNQNLVFSINAESFFKK